MITRTKPVTIQGPSRLMIDVTGVAKGKDMGGLAASEQLGVMLRHEGTHAVDDGRKTVGELADVNWLHRGCIRLRLIFPRPPRAIATEARAAAPARWLEPADTDRESAESV